MILAKTDKGLQVLKDRSVRLTPRQRAAFILFDGRRSLEQVLQASPGLEQADVDLLLDLGLLGRPASGQPLSAPEAPVDALPVARTAQQRYQAAYPIATQLTASLGLRGFRLNLAVEAAGNCEELAALLPKIRAALGPEKTVLLAHALGA